MRLKTMVKLSGLCGVAMAAAAVTPAAANRCGNSVAVDSPTTLVEIARRCNVNLSELYEANPGVDPSNVRPGEHLAVPDERDRLGAASPSPQPVAPTSDNSNTNYDPPAIAHPFIASYDAPVSDDSDIRGVYEVEDVWRPSDVKTHRVRIRDARVSRESPVWLASSGRSGGHYVTHDRMTFQERSKIHIAAATNSIRTNAGPVYVADTKLIECPTLRDEKGAKIHQVQNIISTPSATYVEVAETKSGQVDCTLFGATSAKAQSIAFKMSDLQGTQKGVPPAVFTNKQVTPVMGATVKSVGNAHLSSANFALQGDVVAVSDGCLIMRTATNDIWRLAAAPPSGDLLGKNVTVWGTAAGVGACGAGPAMIVSHAVYAEPVKAD